MMYLNIVMDQEMKSRIRQLGRKHKRSMGSEAYYLIEVGMQSLGELPANESGQSATDVETGGRAS